MASVQVLKLQTSAHKEVSVGGCTDPTKTPQSFQMRTVWFQKWVCTRHHMPYFEVQQKTYFLNCFLWALSNLLAVTDLTGILLVLLVSVPPNTGL